MVICWATRSSMKLEDIPNAHTHTRTSLDTEQAGSLCACPVCPCVCMCVCRLMSVCSSFSPTSRFDGITMMPITEGMLPTAESTHTHTHTHTEEREKGQLLGRCDLAVSAATP